jgi:hypothetical protein
MDSLNLDIDTYTPFDLQNLFSLSPGYTPKDVDKGKARLLEQLNKTKDLGPESKRKIVFFIDTASSRLGGMSGKSDINAGTWAMKENEMDIGASHFVISKPNTVAGRDAKIVDGRLAGTDDVPPGWLNPLNVRTIMMGINIDTRFRDNYYDTNSSDFHLDIPDIQKKVTNMRIATIDIPMTYYAIDRARGDAMMLVFPIEDEYNTWTSAYDAMSGVSDEKDYFYLGSQSNTTYGIWQGKGKYAIVPTLPEPTMEGQYRAAWLVVLPDGNYEIAWNAQSNAQDITRAMNTALSMAQPCLLDTGSGITYILLDNSNKRPYIKNGLGGKVVYTVDRNSGRSIFAIANPPSNTTPELNGFELAFPIDSSGNFAPHTNIQLHLGWQLGFRLGQYVCDTSSGNGATGVSSEGICLVCGPRYMYISIDDGNNNSNSNFTAMLADSTMGEFIMTRINLASSMDSVGVYRCASDVGLSNQLNRTREFFGPVDISRLKIKLLDEYGRPINLNYMDWSMSLVFEKLYD